MYKRANLAAEEDVSRTEARQTIGGLVHSTPHIWLLPECGGHARLRRDTLTDINGNCHVVLVSTWNVRMWRDRTVTDLPKGCTEGRARGAMYLKSPIGRLPDLCGVKSGASCNCAVEIVQVQVDSHAGCTSIVLIRIKNMKQNTEKFVVFVDIHRAPLSDISPSW